MGFSRARFVYHATIDTTQEYLTQTEHSRTTLEVVSVLFDAERRARVRKTCSNNRVSCHPSFLFETHSLLRAFVAFGHVGERGEDFFKEERRTQRMIRRQAQQTQHQQN